MKRYLPLIIIGVVLALALGAAAIMYKGAKHAPENTNASSPNPAEAALGADPPRVHGAANAPVTLEEFGDFECPPCGQLHPELQKIETDYGDKLRFVFRQFPLTQIHKHAYDAARAAEAAGLQGKFWEMHDTLYEKQLEWSLAPDPRAKFAEYAKTLGLDVDRFSSDMVGEIASARVALDMRRGKSLGVRGTPTLFVTGRQLTADETTPEGIRRAIDTAPKEKGK
jgi:protein-disulfide isomerase